ELRASLAPRSQMNNSFFFPSRPRAMARFMTNGMSTRVLSATASPLLQDWPKNVRRVITLRFDFCIKLLLLESLQRHQKRHHPAYALLVGVARIGKRVETLVDRRRAAIVQGVQKTHRRRPIEVEV